MQAHSETMQLLSADVARSGMSSSKAAINAINARSYLVVTLGRRGLLQPAPAVAALIRQCQLLHAGLDDVCCHAAVMHVRCHAAQLPAAAPVVAAHKQAAQGAPAVAAIDKAAVGGGGDKALAAGDEGAVGCVCNARALGDLPCGMGKQQWQQNSLQLLPWLHACGDLATHSSAHLCLAKLSERVCQLHKAVVAHVLVARLKQWQ